LLKYVSIRLFFVNFHYIFKCLTKNVTHANILGQIKGFKSSKRISVLLISV